MNAPVRDVAPISFHDGKVVLYPGDCMALLALLPDNSIDAVCTDPPYHLTSIVKRFGAENAAPAKVGKTGAFARASRGFMGKQWDGGDIAFTPELWVEVLRVLKPGGHMVAFSGTRTYHRMACAIEDAGFEIRDQLAWTYGSGFPKSHDISKAIDKADGYWRGRAGSVVIEEQPAKGREYERNDKGEPISAAAAAAGWGTALKPAWEPICLARKPLSEPTVALNFRRWGTGAINIQACRIEYSSENDAAAAAAAAAEQRSRQTDRNFDGWGMSSQELTADAYLSGSAGAGRWPANFVHDGSDEVLAEFPSEAGAAAPVHRRNGDKFRNTYGAFGGNMDEGGGTFYGDAGSAARFFYCAKADGEDRLNSKHPTVKPVDLMCWLVRLICPKGGVCLDPFAGTGTTGAAAFIEGCRAILIEREAEYQADIARRMELLLSGPDERSRKLTTPEPVHGLPLFAESTP